MHPGYGFLAENARVRQGARGRGHRLHRAAGVSAIDAMGSKTNARDLMKKAGVPIIPGTTEAVPDVEAAMKLAKDEIGFPVAVKASGGGGGKGFRVALERGRARGRLRGRRARGREVLRRRDASTSSATCPTRATSRSRSSPTSTATRSTSASATARSSAATRSSSRRRPRPHVDERAARAHRRGVGQGRRGGRLRRRRHDRGPARRTTSGSSWR